MKNKSALKFIRDEVYRAHFWFGYGDALKYKKLLFKILGEEADDFLEDIEKVQGRYYSINNTGRRVVLVWVNDPKDLGNLAHEISHLVFDTFIYKGIPLLDETTEPFAYYIEFCFDKCLEVINKPKNDRTTLQKDKKKR